jgi:hypothetical protein
VLIATNGNKMRRKKLARLGDVLLTYKHSWVSLNQNLTPLKKPLTAFQN